MKLLRLHSPRQFQMSDFSIPLATWVGSPGTGLRQVLVPVEGAEYESDDWVVFPTRTLRPKLVRRDGAPPGAIVRLSASRDEEPGRAVGKILIEADSCANLTVIAHGLAGLQLTGQRWDEILVALVGPAAFKVCFTAPPDGRLIWDGDNFQEEPFLQGDKAVYLHLDDPRVPKWSRVVREET